MRAFTIKQTKYGFDLKYIGTDGEIVASESFSAFNTAHMARTAAKWCNETPEPVELHPVIGGIDPELDASMNEGPGETKEQWMAKNNLGQGSQWMCKGCCIALGESFENYSGERCMECGVIRDKQ